MSDSSATLSIPAALGNLPDVMKFVSSQAERTGVPAMLLPKLELVAEEIFVNIVNHAHPRTKDDVEIRCAQETHSTIRFFCITLKDWGPPFDPLKQNAPNLNAGLEDRPIGGLGVFLVNKMADRCSYSRDENTNEIRACFSY